ncbi:hypothetical protein L1S32_03835 [Methanogenium sp. S4BF]|uniref:hypothetical protein n=1 Tax=Methanogenium sp. S4BF TaxID=1789226 RepID=UPI002417A1A3|nr:hypothetical protein [Methanogenium sp. S4BF]WFN35261.1 hypothetical protein L1S32_03835 [Methanogenium sp. S4BF]
MKGKSIQIMTVVALIALVIGGIGPYFGFLSDIGQAVICIIAVPAFVVGIMLSWKYRDGEEDYPFMGY